MLSAETGLEAFEKTFSVKIAFVEVSFGTLSILSCGPSCNVYPALSSSSSLPSGLTLSLVQSWFGDRGSLF